MFKYIGIRGHRGAGKETVTYLLGTAMEYYLSHNKSFEGFDEVYDSCVDMIKTDCDYIDNITFNRVFVEHFSEGPKVLLSQLINIPVEYMNDDTMKDNTFINLKDFEVHYCKDKFERYSLKARSKTACELYTDKCMLPDDISGEQMSKFTTWISLRELLIYFGKYTMQNMFGKNVWIKCLKANECERERFYAADKTIYKIFADCKFPSEITYIKDNGGYIIDVSRPEFKKEETEVSNELDTDNRIDYKIVIDDDVDKMQRVFEDLTRNIIE